MADGEERTKAGVVASPAAARKTVAGGVEVAGPEDFDGPEAGRAGGGGE